MSFWQTSFLVLFGAISMLSGMWISDRTPPVTILSATAVQPSVAPGDLLKVHYELDRARSCHGHFDRVLYDSGRLRATLDDLDYGAPPGAMGRDGYTVTIPIPRSFAPGPARYVVISSYRCNLLHRLWPIVTRAEVPFEVGGAPLP